nr:biotin/lipoyl-binding protein [Pseudomonas sp.]
MEVVSEVTGKVWKMAVDEGAVVQEGDVLMIIESMKMEIPVEASASGPVRLLVAEGEAVEEGMTVAKILSR